MINSSEIASIYKDEFENFLNNKYHNVKQSKDTNSVFVNDVLISVYFSPQNSPISQKIIPEIKRAKNYIYIPAFIITHKGLTDELINAKKRGVDVKVITDAVSAKNKFSTHRLLRQNDIKVKTENFAGKMHMKTILIDDKTAFLGSMNFTKNGDIYNDENCIKLENPSIVKNLKLDFLHVWSKIPDVYLKKDPPAESIESVGSCFDGVDNDFDGLIDGDDSGCFMKR